jgi:hypothetical protein
MTKPQRNDVPVSPGEDVNSISPGVPSSVRPWTQEEMESALPLPLPTTKPESQISTPDSVPYVGRGETKTGGRPENDGMAS